MLVLGIMFTVPVFTISTYRDETEMYEFGLHAVTMYDDEPLSLAFNDTF
jgi:hypothetical protein